VFVDILLNAKPMRSALQRTQTPFQEKRNEKSKAKQSEFFEKVLEVVRGSMGSIFRGDARVKSFPLFQGKRENISLDKDRRSR
jgi:hypothetical protein